MDYKIEKLFIRIKMQWDVGPFPKDWLPRQHRYPSGEVKQASSRDGAGVPAGGHCLAFDYLRP